MENPIKMDDLGVPLFLETSTWQIMILRILDKYIALEPSDSSREDFFYHASVKNDTFWSNTADDTSTKKGAIEKDNFKDHHLGGTINLSDDG